MGSKMSLELSDGLSDLSKLFADYEHETRVLDPEDARAIRACIVTLRSAARILENEVSRSRWNEAARRERDGAKAVLDALSEPGTNVHLFPIIPRPFSDGRPGGAA